MSGHTDIILGQMFGAGLTAIGSLGMLGLLAMLGLIGYCIYSKPSRTIAWHTWKSAVRFKFFWVMAVLLLVVVVGLPMILQGDGSAEGLAQILISYTLSAAFFFLAAGTLWMSAGSLARDIEDAQMQMIVTKPIPRWQIWMGKWLGFMAMNLVLLAGVALALYGVVEYRADKLTGDELKRISKETDLAVFQSAVKAGVDVFERDPKTLKMVRAKGRQPLLEQSVNELRQTPMGYEIMRFTSVQSQTNVQPRIKPITEIRQEVASLKEKKLREQVLIARAALPLKDVRIAFSPTNTIPLKQQYEAEVAKDAPKLIAQEEARRRKEAEVSASMNREFPLPLILNSTEREFFTNQVRLTSRLNTQKLDPGQGIQFQFGKPLGYHLPEDQRLVLKFSFEDAFLNYTSSRQYGILHIYGPQHRPGLVGHKPPNVLTLTARKTHELKMHGHSINTNQAVESIFGTSDTFCVTLVNVSDKVGRSPAKLMVPFMDPIDGSIDSTKVQVLYPESGFALNLIRSCGILLAWLGILAAMGLVAASFMSFNVSAFACLAILFIATVGMDTMKAVIKDGTIMQTHTGGERDSSWLDAFAVNSFRGLVPLIDSQKAYSPISNLAAGQSTTWEELLRAYSFIWGISGWLLGLLGAIIFSHRQLAITPSQAP